MTEVNNIELTPVGEQPPEKQVVYYKEMFERTQKALENSHSVADGYKSDKEKAFKVIAKTRELICERIHKIGEVEKTVNHLSHELCSIVNALDALPIEVYSAEFYNKEKIAAKGDEQNGIE